MPIAPNLRPTGTVETPAMRGKRYRADALGEREMLARHWRTLAYTLAATQVLALALIGYLASQPRLVPVYIEVEPQAGRMVVLGAGTPPYTLREATMKKEVGEFVEVLRRLSPDKHWMQQQWKAIFLKVTPRGHRTLVPYAQEVNPLVATGERRVEILHVLAQTERTYDVRWQETTFTDAGTLQERATYRGLFTWVLRPSDSAVSLAALTANPSGMLFDTWQWSQER